MKTTLKLIVSVAFVLSGCGTDTQSSGVASISDITAFCSTDQTYRDEYDCDGSTRVTSARILDTLWNGPASGQFIADIKNVDVVKESLQVYIGSDSRLRYHVFVRSWVDFGAKTLAIKAIDKDRPERALSERALRVGQDAGGQFIYLMSLPVTQGLSHQLYLQIQYRGQTHFSNVGRPYEFFEVHARGI